jgi:thiol-disulfide isomerase/thioredoxin
MDSFKKVLLAFVEQRALPELEDLKERYGSEVMILELYYNDYKRVADTFQVVTTPTYIFMEGSHELWRKNALKDVIKTLRNWDSLLEPVYS